MSIPTAEAVAAYLGQGDDFDVVTLAGAHLPLIVEIVRTYTRGRGFDTFDQPLPSVAAVIISATARLTNNPEGTITVSIDDYQTRRTVFEGFSLIERQVLDSYRRKAA
ncbi:hypothetical protein [Cryobacterium psychrophilum]|uniref:Phage gp6-like head-tail connector protein n=1 Tax=Cryobacterium psychrophilum TaxID=41988 RepID=A0A4Y8KR63_9MICO|nr:hypothetical protein [Cryobacterium psychrophilum]TFD80542.1 hypothetical protein E3T53_05570 [Cryobacterium psychrophilum]